MLQIKLRDEIFIYEIERKPIRSLRLRLQTRHSFIVSCPILTPQFVITNFIQAHADWIIKNSPKIKSSISLLSLTELPILDTPFDLVIKKSLRDSVVIFENEQKIYVNTIHLSNTHLKSLLDRKLRSLSLRLINAELKKISAEFGFQYGHVSVRNQKSRFGSCSHAGNLNFNWQIMFFPLPVFRHILFHECTHLKIKDHSLRFWHQLSLYDPDFRQHRLWLRRSANKYMIF